jgi:NodT family efflux transporter outer membrane factor (OMF) lipoprotein
MALPVHRLSHPVLISIIALLLNGCSHREYAPRALESIPIPDDSGSADLEPAAWSQALGSPELTELLKNAYRGNFQWRKAYARINEAEALARQANAARWPFVGGSARAAKTKRRFTAPQGEVVFRSQDYELAAAASYEVDLWGKLAKRASAARLETEARTADAKALAVRLNAGIAQNYFTYLSALERTALLRRQKERAEVEYQLLEERYLKGGASALDLSQQTRRIESFASGLVRTAERANLARQALANLTAAPPQSFSLKVASRPEPPPLPESGFQADRLLQRPDLRAALLRLEAADKQTAAQAAERLPEITLSARAFTSEESISRLFSNFLWSIAGEASQTLFDAGTTKARIEASEARAEAALADFGQAWMDALEDLSNAFTRAKANRDLLESALVELDFARKSLELARERYLGGRVDYLRVLDAAQAVDRLEEVLVDARLGKLLARVQLIRALGGTWLAPEPPDPITSNVSLK